MGALKTGGQGSIYKARRIGEIITAVKLLPTPLHSEDKNDKNYRDFQNEVTKLKKVNQEPNPNVVKILSFGITESGSFPFIEMEYIEGPDLEELLKPPHDALFTIKEIIKVAEQLSNALAHCHKQDVKHGDIKSNNVKFNRHTGNYILLDFGLAVMSDEQRRTSLRHAGAVEFMAPEQTEGELLFQSDVYSFGVVIFELLAGQVPFPLGDKGESARNAVMLAHREAAPPDIRELRKQNMPDNWSDVKKKREAEIPDWLLSMVYRCLRKKPDERFLNGTDLHEFICINSTLPASVQNVAGPDNVIALKKQNEQYRREKEQLQQTLSKYQNEINARDHELKRLQNLLSGNYAYPQRRRRGLGAGFLVAAFITLLVLAGIAYVYVQSKNADAEPAPAEVKKQEPQTTAPQTKTVIAQYRVGAAKAYFHNDADPVTRRAGFLQQDDLINVLEEKSGFVYTEFTNSRGQISKGWIQKDDLLTLDEWQRQVAARQQRPEVLYKKSLDEARNLLRNFQVNEALAIYKPLVDKEVPEAMYQYGNLALQDQNPEIDCATAISLVKKASDKDYSPAKTTLGYLYLFAENKEVLATTNYNRCTYEKDTRRGLQLLSEAAVKGDESAKKILDQFNATTTQPPQQQ